jgi:hypothetical protein
MENEAKKPKTDKIFSHQDFLDLFELYRELFNGTTIEYDCKDFPNDEKLNEIHPELLQSLIKAKTINARPFFPSISPSEVKIQDNELIFILSITEELSRDTGFCNVKRKDKPLELTWEKYKKFIAYCEENKIERC